MAKLSEDVRADLRFLAFYLGNGTLQLQELPWVDYSDVLNSAGSGSVLEQAFAIWSNVLDIDPSGKVLNREAAQKRVAQYIRQQAEPTYIVDPPFEEWELQLYS